MSNATSHMVYIHIRQDEFAEEARRVALQIQAEMLHRRTRMRVAPRPLPRPQMHIGRNPIAPLPRRSC